MTCNFNIVRHETKLIPKGLFLLSSLGMGLAGELKPVKPWKVGFTRAHRIVHLQTDLRNVFIFKLRPN